MAEVEHFRLSEEGGPPADRPPGPPTWSSGPGELTLSPATTAVIRRWLLCRSFQYARMGLGVGLPAAAQSRGEKQAAAAAAELVAEVCRHLAEEADQPLCRTYWQIAALEISGPPPAAG